MNTNTNCVDIIIIGAGIAGLECATKLHSYGLKNLVVLEAQDYIGGRIRTDFINNDESLPLEYGATWIHGDTLSTMDQTENPISKLIKDNPNVFRHTKTKFFNFDTNDFVYWADENGVKYDANVCKDMYEKYVLWNLEAKSIYDLDNVELPLNVKSFTQYMELKLESLIVNDADEMKNFKRRVLQRLLKAETAESGCATMELCSLVEYGSYMVPLEPNFEFPGGFSKLISFLANQIPKEQIKLEHPVKYVKKVNDGQELDVECFNGSSFRAKHVIITCSVNYLQKYYKRMFEPLLLDNRKIEAINSVKMGTVDKIFMFYDDLSFFPEKANSLHPIYTSEKSGRSADDLQNSWQFKTYAFDKFYDNMLLVWITGLEAEYAESLSYQEISKTLTQLLRQLLGKNNIPEPNKIIMTKWHSNPYVLGSYSYIDVEGRAADIERLAEPIYVDQVPRVLFAGEATSLNYYSTAHGAYLSGQREAKRLLDIYSCSSSK